MKLPRGPGARRSRVARPVGEDSVLFVRAPAMDCRGAKGAWQTVLDLAGVDGVDPSAGDPVVEPQSPSGGKVFRGGKLSTSVPTSLKKAKMLTPSTAVRSAPIFS